MPNPTGATSPAAQYDSPCGPAAPLFYVDVRDRLAELARQLDSVEQELAALNSESSAAIRGQLRAPWATLRATETMRYAYREAEDLRSRSHRDHVDGYITTPQNQACWDTYTRARRLDLSAWHALLTFMSVAVSTLPPPDDAPLGEA